MQQVAVSRFALPSCILGGGDAFTSLGLVLEPAAPPVPPCELTSDFCVLNRCRQTVHVLWMRAARHSWNPLLIALLKGRGKALPVALQQRLHQQQQGGSQIVLLTDPAELERDAELHAQVADCASDLGVVLMPCGEDLERVARALYMVMNSNGQRRVAVRDDTRINTQLLASCSVACRGIGREESDHAATAQTLLERSGTLRQVASEEQTVSAFFDLVLP